MGHGKNNRAGIVNPSPELSGARHDPAIVLAGGMAFLVPLGIYILTLAPTVTFEDSGCFIAAAYHLGIAHPPGYPLWCLAAHAFTWLPLGSIAQRVHLCVAVFAAATALMIYLAALRLTRNWIAALAAALALGFSRLFWSQSVIAEVYTLNAFLTVIAIYCAIRWKEEFQARWLYALALTIGLGLTNHLLMGLIAPVLAGYLLIPHWRRLFKTRVLIIGALLFIMGLSVYAYLPIRARADPPVNWGNPRTPALAMDHILRKAYYTKAEQIRYSGRIADAWQHSVAALAKIPEAFTWPLIVLSLAGVVRLWQGRRDVFWMSLAIIFANVVVLNIFNKTPYAPREIFVQRVFYIPAHIIIALWIAYGCAWVLAYARQRARAAAPVVAIILAAGLAWTLMTNYPHNDMSRYRRARDLGCDFLDSAPAGAGLLLVTDDIVFTCAYLKLVEGLRPDVQILHPYFGYRSGKFSAMISDMPVTPDLIKDMPDGEGLTSVPCGLGYWLVNASLIPPVTWQSFRPLPHPPRDPAPASDLDYAPCELDACARYAYYHARLGAKLMLAGQNADAQREFAASEKLLSDDPYAYFLLASIYQEFGLHRERVNPMLEKALALLDRNYSPSAYRFYPVTRQDIIQAMTRIKTSTGGTVMPIVHPERKGWKYFNLSVSRISVDDRFISG